MPAPLDVPPLVRERATSNGVAGRRWLDDLPDLVAALADKWGLELGRSFPGGTSAFVVAATDRSGRACVLKVAMPLEMDDGDEFGRSVLVHQLAGGRGCAELLDHDMAAPAMLLERLGPNLDDLGLPLAQLLETVATTLRSVLAAGGSGLRPAHRRREGGVAGGLHHDVVAGARPAVRAGGDRSRPRLLR